MNKVTYIDWKEDDVRRTTRIRVISLDHRWNDNGFRVTVSCGAGSVVISNTEFPRTDKGRYQALARFYRDVASYLEQKDGIVIREVG